MRLTFNCFKTAINKDNWMLQLDDLEARVRVVEKWCIFGACDYDDADDDAGSQLPEKLVWLWRCQ